MPKEARCSFVIDSKGIHGEEEEQEDGGGGAVVMVRQ